jgi:hypothetical protein
MGARWWLAGLAMTLLAGCRLPNAAPAPAPTPPPAPPQAEAPRPEAKPVELAELGLKVTLAAGWQARAGAAPISLPDAPHPALFEKPGGKETPLLVLAKVASASLGTTDPKQAPAALLAGLRKSLGATPGLTLADAAAPALPAFASAKVLAANGPLPDLGLSNAAAKLVAAVTSDGQAYLLAGFAADSAGLGEIETILASVEPLAAKAAAPAPAN